MNDTPNTTEAAAFDPAAHGWELVNSAAFGELVGPIWRRDDGERLRFGFVVAPKHLNRAGILHGGMLMTLADQAMAMTARRVTGGKRHATIELNTQFVGGVRLIPEFVALLVALSTYTAAFIAEVVRAAFPRAELTFAHDRRRQAIVDSWPEDVDDARI